MSMTVVKVSGKRSVVVARGAATSARSLAASLAAAAQAEAAANGLSATLTYFPTLTATNLYDNSLADPRFANTAAQLWRVHNASAALSGQSSATLPSYLASKRIAVTAGQQYTLSIHDALPGWTIYFTGSPRIDFLKADGTFLSSQTTGFTRGSGDRSLTFTPPANAAFAALNFRNSADFTAASPMTVAAADQFQARIMLNTGSIALDYQAYIAPGSRAPDAAAFGLKSADCAIAIQRPYAFIRTPCQQSPLYDVVQAVLFAETPVETGIGAPTRTGVIDFTGTRFIPKATKHANIVSAYNRSTMIASVGADQRSPFKINGTFLGGGHGLPGRQITANAHGYSTGARVQDGAGRQHIVMRIVDANVFWLGNANTGATDAWVIGSFAPSGTLTKISGTGPASLASYTDNGSVQLTSIYRGLTIALTVDDEVVSADGIYPGDDIRMSEAYDIVNCASMLGFLEANPGSSDTVNASIPSQVRVTNEFHFDAFGALICYRTEEALQAYARLAGAPMSDYNAAGIQFLRPALTTDSIAGMSDSVWAYAPDLTGLVNGTYDFKATANVTANASGFVIPKTLAADANDPPSHFAMIGKLAGVPVAGLAYGLARTVGQGKPVNRKDLVNLWWMSTAEKGYPVTDDDGAVAAGAVVTSALWRVWWRPQAGEATIPGVIFTIGRKVHMLVTAHTALNRKWLPLPAALKGLPVAVLKAGTGATLHTDTVMRDGVMLSGGAYLDTILEIG